jgi:hypothetical protein
VLPLPEYGVPAQASLRAFQNQEFEELAVVVDRHAPFFVVIGGLERVGIRPWATLLFSDGMLLDIRIERSATAGSSASRA